MNVRYRGRHRARSLRTPITLLLAVLAVAGLTLPGAYGAYLARVNNNANTAATNAYFTCTAAQGSGTTPAAYFTYPFGEAVGTLGATDISGNARSGSYSASGVTYGVANPAATGACPRDNRTVITLNGTSGYASYSPLVAIAAPASYSVEIWFKTTAAQGKLIGFGNSRNGLSTVYERQLYIDASGKLVYGVYNTAVRTLTSSASVTDGVWHHAVGTLSGSGMFLYLDGKQVGANTSVTTEEANTGFWRIGWDSLANWTNVPASNYFSGSLAFASVYTSALNATQVAQHFAAGD